MKRMLEVQNTDGSVELVKDLCRQKNCTEPGKVDVTYYIRGYALDIYLCDKHWDSFKHDMGDLID